MLVRNKDRCAFREKPSGDRIGIRLLVTPVRQYLEDFGFRSGCDRAETRCMAKPSVSPPGILLFYRLYKLVPLHNMCQRLAAVSYITSMR